MSNVQDMSADSQDSVHEMFTNRMSKRTMQKVLILAVFVTMFLPFGFSLYLEYNPEYLHYFAQGFHGPLIKRTMLFYAIYCITFLGILIVPPVNDRK